MDAGRRITSLDEVPEDSTFLFTVRETGSDEDSDELEAIVLRVEDGVAGWLNYCQHLTHINLDKGSGAPTRGGEVVCANHGAMFDRDTGRCTHGPCEGAYLNPLDVRAENGAVYLTDEDYEFVGAGPIEREDDDLDLSSTSNVEF